MTDFSTDAARALAGPSWLIDRRVGAAEAFACAVPPDVADEEWRYSAIRDFDLSDFELATGMRSAPTTELEIDSAAVVRTVNGQIISVDVGDELSAAGVYVGSLAEVSQGSELLGAVAAEAADYFTVLNDAFAADPVLIRVPPGLVLNRPIVVTHHLTGERTAAFPRLVVDIGADAQAEVLDHHTSSDGPLLVCPVVRNSMLPRLADSAISMCSNSARAHGSFSSQLARAERDASLTASTAGFRWQAMPVLDPMSA